MNRRSLLTGLIATAVAALPGGKSLAQGQRPADLAGCLAEPGIALFLDLFEGKPVMTPEELLPGANWQLRRESLGAWLKSLPKPVGILTWGVQRGVELINEAKQCGFQVPDDVAILGGDDDELLCESVQPSLSGIIVPAEQIGHEAARLLLSLLHHRRAKAPPRCALPPLGISARASTEITRRPSTRACGAYGTHAGDGTTRSPSKTVWRRKRSSFEPGPTSTSPSVRSIWKRRSTYSATVFRRSGRPRTGRYSRSVAAARSAATMGSGTGNGD